MVVVPVVEVAVPTNDEKARIRLSRVAKGKSPFRFRQVVSGFSKSCSETGYDHAF